MAEVIPVGQRRVGVAPLRTPTASASTGVQVGNALSQLGSSIERHAERVQLQHDIGTVQSRDNDFSAQAINKRQEFLDLRGEQAKGSQAKYQEWYRVESGNVVTGLQNNRQREMWEKLSSGRLNTDLSTLAKHQSVEHRRHLDSNISGSVTAAQETMTQDPFNEDAMGDSLDRIRLSIATARPGTDNSAAIAQAEGAVMLTTLQAMTSKDPIQAETYLERWKDALGASYPQAKEIVSREALLDRARLEYPDDFTDQRKFVADASAGDYSTKAKSYARNQIASDQADFNIAEGERFQEVEETWFNAYQAEKLIEAEVEESDLPVSRKNLWVSKIKAQRNQKIAQANAIKAGKREEEAARQRANAAKTREQYALALEVVDLNPESITPADIYTVVDPNGGGLTGEQATSLVAKLQKNLAEKGVKDSIKSAKTKVREMYNRGDFGDLGKVATRAKAKTIKADIYIGLEEWVQSNPDKDPNEWLDSKVNLIAEEEAAQALNAWFGGWIPGGTTPEQQRRISQLTDPDDPLFVVRQYVSAQGVDPASLPDEALEAIGSKKEFLDYKAGLLRKVTGR